MKEIEDLKKQMEESKTKSGDTDIDNLDYIRELSQEVNKISTYNEGGAYQEGRGRVAKIS